MERSGYKMINDIEPVSIKKLQKMCKILKENGKKEASFEFLMASCFPKVYENIKEELRYQYTLGYTESLKSLESKED